MVWWVYHLLRLNLAREPDLRLVLDILNPALSLRYLRRHLKQYVDPVELKFQRDEWRDLHIVHLCVGSEGVIECICGGQMHVSNIGMERKEDLGRRLKKIPVVNGLARDVRHTS